MGFTRRVTIEANNCISISLNCSDELKETVKDFYQKNLSHVEFVALEQQAAGICFCAGGDGTLNFVVNTLAKNKNLSEIKICYYPDGTGNDFARSTNLIDTPLKDLLKLSVTNKVDKIPLGKFNDQYFINMATCGEFARVTTDVDSGIKDAVGPFAYFAKGLSKLSDLEALECEFSVGDRSPKGQKVFGFFIGNSKYCGGGLKATNQADALKAELDLLIIQEMPISELVSLGLQLQKEETAMGDFGASYEKIQNMKFRSKKEIPISLDGERLKCCEGQVKISELSAQMFLP